MIKKQKTAWVPVVYWKAITENDRAFDDQFFYGVQTTGIFCRPSCKSRLPNKENVRIFKNAFIALEQGYRPCKRCKPDGLKLPAEEWSQHIKEWLDTHYTENVTLDILADIFHGSPYHLQRSFKKSTGLSPLSYLQQKRLEKAAQDLLATNRPVADIGESVGFANPSYFITLFKKKAGQTPAQFRKGVNYSEPKRTND
ncbi:bifunctional transcriptional activator/DNA repair enzyme AdaA [Planomicrobium sp. CPCC 101110]|uniref:bifunctional transcriptional activator/DNA repair enzyme AdaA n=1 Tax=Planomicrobium sp. CPCC 101110 TaxID=2599619 RepID=UPI0011B58B56|nr:bifunctional transcriptional activator/DNA repair enzyme AdaA [Planomicrobium sp. CPCC 101110]TWT24825.1 methylphosphotriester-DNA--protein-cysteine methyltransferase family protein [Planomicrobium sp. CPCC 101110]